MIYETIERSMLQGQPWSDLLYKVYLTMENGVQHEIDTLEFKPEGLIPIAEFILEYGL